MQVKWLAERICALPKVEEMRSVVILDCFWVADLREAVHHKAVKSKCLDTAFEFARRRLGVLHRQGRKSAQLRRVARDMLGKDVVGAARNINGFLYFGMPWMPRELCGVTRT